MPVILLFFFILSFREANSITAESLKDEREHHFTGRVSKINSDAHLMRVRTDFTNIKYLQKDDRVTFWNETNPGSRCLTLVQGRANDYLLLKIISYESCIRNIHFTTGSYLHFDSLDLAENVQIGRELVEILLKKEMAMNAKKLRLHKELETHVEKVEAVNKRFEILRQKLDIEWRKELSDLEEDKARVFAEYKDAEARLNEIHVKLEVYKVEDHNLKLDRWSLDPALYIKK